MLMALWALFVTGYYFAFKDNMLAADIGRFVGLVMAALIFGAWVVVMGRSAESYAKAQAGDHRDDTDLREHIWEVTLSYLIYVAGTVYDMIQNIGGPIEFDDFGVMLVAAPLGVHALYLFIAPGRPVRMANRDVIARPALHAIAEQVLGTSQFCILDRTRDLRIVNASDDYLTATATTREYLIGKTVREAFPENPDFHNGHSEVEASFNRVIETREADRMKPLRYDIRSEDGEYEVRWWQVVNSPILGADGEVEFIFNASVDVTSEQTRS